METLTKEEIVIIEEREKLANYLEKVKDGEKRYFEREYLEEILFDVFSDGEQRVLKRIGFLSNALSKIDLSEISFDDVSFNGEDYPNLDEGEQVDLSNTNAVIDFSKSYEYKRTGQVFITSFDFHGTDLSNNNWHDLTQKCFGFIKNTNLSGTKTKLTDEGKKVYLKLNHTDLSDNDLSDISIDHSKQISMSPEIAFIACGLAKTGINIGYRGNDSIIKSQIRTNPNYDGCTYNGRTINIAEDIDTIRTQAKKKIMGNPAIKK